MSPERRTLLSLCIPIVGAILFTHEWLIPGFMRHFFFDHVVWFVVTYWLGLMFTNMYFYMTQDMKESGASPRTIAIAAGVTAFVMLMAAGGPSAIWKTPWLVGAGVMPGIDIAWPITKEWWMKRQTTAAAAATATSPPSLTTEPSADAGAEEPA